MWCWPGPTAAIASPASVLVCFGAMTGACNKECSDDQKYHIDCKSSAVHWQRDEASKAACNFSTSAVDQEGMACMITSQAKHISMENDAAIDRVG